MFKIKRCFERKSYHNLFFKIIWGKNRCIGVEVRLLITLGDGGSGQGAFRVLIMFCLDLVGLQEHIHLQIFLELLLQDLCIVLCYTLIKNKGKGRFNHNWLFQFNNTIMQSQDKGCKILVTLLAALSKTSVYLKTNPKSYQTFLKF